MTVSLYNGEHTAMKRLVALKYDPASRIAVLTAGSQSMEVGNLTKDQAETLAIHFTQALERRAIEFKSEVLNAVERHAGNLRDTMLADFDRAAKQLREAMLTSNVGIFRQTLNTFMNRISPKC